MAANKFLSLDSLGAEVEIAALVSSLGAGDALKIVSTGADGRLDISLMPAGIGADTESVVASEALSAGGWVNIYDNGGTQAVRNASNLDSTKPANGFVKQAYAQSDVAVVYLRGVNDQVPVGSLVAADRGKNFFLGTAGAGTLTPPTGSGNYLQVLGPIIEVGATASINFSYSPGIVRA